MRQILTALARDPKRTAVTAGLGLVMLLLWSRMLFGGPGSATASLIRPLVPPSVPPLEDSGMTSTSVPATTPVLDWLAEPAKPVNRNLFAIHLDDYTRAADQSPTADSTVDPVNLSNETDEQPDRRLLIENLRSQASALKLQGTVLGTNPQALINGQLLKPGDMICGFVIGNIEPRRVQIQQDGVELQIEMP